MHKHTMLISLFGMFLLSACFHLTTDDNSNDKLDVLPNAKGGPYYKLKPNEGDAFEKSFKAYVTAMLSESSYYRTATEGAENFSGGSTQTTSPGSGVNPAPSTGSGAATADGGSAGGVSQTNTIVQGVDESDLVKTDGHYLFVVSNPHTYHYLSGIAVNADMPVTNSSTRIEKPILKVYSVDSIAPNAEEIYSLELPDNIHFVDGIYLDSDSQTGRRQITIIGQENSHSNERFDEKINIIKYDFATAGEPVKSWEMKIEGFTNSTRIVDGNIVLASRKNIFLKGILGGERAPVTEAEIASAVDAIDVNTLLPKAWLNGVEVSLVRIDDCVVPTETNTNSDFSLGISSFSIVPLQDPGNGKSVCTLESSSEVFVSQSSLYLSKNDYVEDIGEGTLIHKFSIDASGIRYRASGRVPGNIGWKNRLFRMSEHNGFFRIVTTSYEHTIGSIEPMFWGGGNQSHHLYILSEDVDDPSILRVVSQLPNNEKTAAIGKPGESLYGVRFFGDYGYVVTFRKVDPLYVINMVDPKSPFIEGELELPGYSDYLHPVNDDIIIGLGKDAVEENGTAWYQGLKLGVFDVSDKTNPKIVQETIIGKRGTESIALSEHHAFTYLYDAQSETARFAFPIELHGGITPYSGGIASASQFYPWQFSGLQLFELSLAQDSVLLTDAGVVKSSSANESSIWSRYSGNTRSVFVDDAVFLTDAGEVWSANWYSPSSVNTTDTVAQVTGFLNIETLYDQGNSSIPRYSYSIVDRTSDEKLYIGRSQIIDNFVSSNNTFNRLITLQGDIVSIDGEELRRLEVKAIDFFQPF